MTGFKFVYKKIGQHDERFPFGDNNAIAAIMHEHIHVDFLAGVPIQCTSDHKFHYMMSSGYGKNVINVLFNKLVKVKMPFLYYGGWKSTWIQFESDDDLELQLAISGFLQKE